MVVPAWWPVPDEHWGDTPITDEDDMPRDIDQAVHNALFEARLRGETLAVAIECLAFEPHKVGIVTKMVQIREMALELMEALNALDDAARK